MSAPAPDVTSAPRSNSTVPAGRVPPPSPDVAVFTAGRDKPYALGLGPALAAQGLSIDFLGSDLVDGPEVRGQARIRFLNLRNQSETARLATKCTRVFVYYLRLIGYAARSRAPIFHLLWNNKFESVDRTLLMLYYRLLRKRVVFTAHNVNAGERDGNDSRWNRWTLRFQYQRCDHIFVHTTRMKDALQEGYGVAANRITVIPFGINNTLPVTGVTRAEARQRLGLPAGDPTLLFFGNIAPYKGVDLLIEAFVQARARQPSLQLVIAGRVKGSEAHWQQIEKTIQERECGANVHRFIRYIPDEEVELYYKAADALVLPYRHVFQSGVLFLGYSFGLPVLATDVGSLRDDIIIGRTGWICPPENPRALAESINHWLASDLYAQRDAARPVIQAHANDRYSWQTVASLTKQVYSTLRDEASS